MDGEQVKEFIPVLISVAFMPPWAAALASSKGPHLLGETSDFPPGLMALAPNLLEGGGRAEE